MIMKTKTSIFIIGLVTIAAIATGTVLGVGLTGEKPINKVAQKTYYLTISDMNATVSMKKGDTLNLTLKDFGDGGYLWSITQTDNALLQQVNQFTWGSSGMLGDFGQDTWVFTAANTGSMMLKLECARSFGDHEICQQFMVHIDIV
jgi:predicted secreted protein